MLYFPLSNSFNLHCIINGSIFNFWCLVLTQNLVLLVHNLYCFAAPSRQTNHLRLYIAVNSFVLKLLLAYDSCFAFISMSFCFTSPSAMNFGISFIQVFVFQLQRKIKINFIFIFIPILILCNCICCCIYIYFHFHFCFIEVPFLDSSHLSCNLFWAHPTHRDSKCWHILFSFYSSHHHNSSVSTQVHSFFTNQHQNQNTSSFLSQLSTVFQFLDYLTQ